MSEHTMTASHITEDAVEHAVRNCERLFVAAGGDGTINALLNAIMNRIDRTAMERLTLGAIGLGSSNDFHKPHETATFVGGFPAAIDAERALPRDAGRLSYVGGGCPQQKYFLVNASIGVTANANHLFGNPDPLLRGLKYLSTPMAIAYAALKTIAVARNLHVTLRAGTEHTYNLDLTNLAVLKSPYVSGNLKYPLEVDAGNGFFEVVVHHSLSRTELLTLLLDLARNRRNGAKPEANSFQTSSLSISAEEEFAVEFDGETILTREVNCCVMHRALKVCR
jgi:diacylglycerol kinase family enzyme